MTIRRRSLVVAAGVAGATVLGAGAWWAARNRQALGTPDMRLQSLLDRTVSDGSALRNCTLAVARGDGSFEWAGVAGAARAAPHVAMAADTPIYTASVTKLYTATVVMMLADAGKLALQDPMARFLPGTLIRGINAHGGQDRSPVITIEQLLAHRSGIADYYTQPGKDGRTVEELVQADPAHAWTPEALLDRVRSELAPVAAPGERTFYSDANYLLLGRVIETITGRQLGETFDEMLLAPLGLVSTFMSGDVRAASLQSKVAAVYRGTTDITRSRSNPLYGADGALVSTPREMLAFLKALRGGRLARPASVTAMHEWHPWRFPLEYGLGTMHFRLPPATAHLAGLPPLWGHSGSTGSFLYCCEELGLLFAGTLDQVEGLHRPFMLMRKAIAAIGS